jgi:hypothetical protein
MPHGHRIKEFLRLNSATDGAATGHIGVTYRTAKGLIYRADLGPCHLTTMVRLEPVWSAAHIDQRSHNAASR